MSIEKRIDALESKAGQLRADRVDLIVIVGLEADGKQHDCNFYWSGWMPRGFIQLRDGETQDEFRERAEQIFRGRKPGHVGRCVATSDDYGMPTDLPNLDTQPAGA